MIIAINIIEYRKKKSNKREICCEFFCENVNCINTLEPALWMDSVKVLAFSFQISPPSIGDGIAGEYGSTLLSVMIEPVIIRPKPPLARNV